jgi:Fe-S-cluster containining protein
MVKVRLGTVFDDAEYFEVKFNCIICGKCCLGTEMELLPEDVERIMALGYSLDQFAHFDGERWRLRSVNGHCYFLDTGTNRCRIYEHRPVGCRIYPIQYDGGVYVDKSCPTWQTVPESELRRIGKFLPSFVERSMQTHTWIKVKYGYR